MRTDPKPMEDFAMWAMLQPGGQKGSVSNLKALVHDWITMATQKNSGQDGRSGKGIPWEPCSKAVSWDNLERVKMGILCESVALVLSGKLDGAVGPWISVRDRLPEDDRLVLVADWDGEIRVGCFFGKRFAGSDIKPTHWMDLPEPPDGTMEDET